MPQLGETVDSGTVLRWFKQAGESVQADEPLFEVETDKVAMDIPAPATGQLAQILVSPGETVAVGTKLAVLVTLDDDESAAPSGSAADSPARIADEGFEFVPFTSLRQRIGTHMVRSKATSPHVLQAVEVDFSSVAQTRSAHPGLTYLPFVAYAVCRALERFPLVNSTVEPTGLRVSKRVNLAIAVDLSFDGLVAPVIRGADTLSVSELAAAIEDVSGRARGGKLVPDDLAGGTYTISNSGGFGTLITAPIINQPQAAIMSMDGIRKRAVVIAEQGEERIVARPVGVLAQSFDHRAFDGAYSAAFLSAVRERIENTLWQEEVLAARL